MTSVSPYDQLWIPLACFTVFVSGFLFYLAFSVRQLPPRPATHFNFRGLPNGSMNRFLYVPIMLVLGLALALSVLMPALLAKSNQTALHVAHADYWLAPERADQTCAYLLGHSLWFASLSIAFIGGLHCLIVRANQKAPPRISMGMVLLVVACFAAGVLFWEHRLTQHFSQIG